MSAVLSRWGNSLAVRIPSHIASQAALKLGDELDLRVSRSGRITLEQARKDIDFSAIYAQITPETRPEFVASASEIGQESVTW